MSAPAIPNQFHFVFGLQEQTEPFHLVHYLCLASCLEVNRPERVYFYYHHEPFGPYWDLVKDRIVPVEVALVPRVAEHVYSDPAFSYFRYAHHSDFIRLEQLVRRGGVYADIDTLFVNPIPPQLFSEPFVIGRETDVREPSTGIAKPSLCNAYLMSARESAFGRLWLDEMAGAFDGTWSGHSCFLPQRLSRRHPEWVHVEPSRTFYKHMWTPDGLHTLLRGCDRDFEGVLSMHLWAHLWWHPDRSHVPGFHAGLLTDEYFRTVDTTYTVAARPFLPEAPRRRIRNGLAGVVRSGRILARRTVEAARAVARRGAPRARAPRRAE